MGETSGFATSTSSHYQLYESRLSWRPPLSNETKDPSVITVLKTVYLGAPLLHGSCPLPPKRCVRDRVDHTYSHPDVRPYSLVSHSGLAQLLLDDLLHDLLHGLLGTVVRLGLSLRSLIA